MSSSLAKGINPALRAFKTVTRAVTHFGGPVKLGSLLFRLVRDHGIAGTAKRIVAFSRGTVVNPVQSTPPVRLDAEIVLPTGALPAGCETRAEHPTLGVIGVHAHIFYPDEAGRMAARLNHIPFAYDLYVSTDSLEKKAEIEEALASASSARRIDIRVCENRGRDIAPMVGAFAADLMAHEVAVHLHSKKSPYGQETAGWSDFLYDGILHSPLYVYALIGQLADTADLGVVSPPGFPPIIKHMHWADMRGTADAAMVRMGFDAERLDAPLRFPAGSFYWFRTAALRQLFEAGFQPEDFEPEAGQMNDTLAHAIERLPAYIAAENGSRFQTVRAQIGRETALPITADVPATAPAGPEQAPMVSIILPVHNQWAYTRGCLNSILAFTDAAETPFEVIVADDRSTDETAECLAADYPWVVHVPQPENLRFLLNCNRAAERARGRYLMFLNNDTQVQPGWLSSLVDTFERYPDAGLVGSKLIYPDGSLQEAGGVVWRNGGALNYGRDGNPRVAEYNYVRKTDYVSGAAILVDHALWKQLGGFDERFVPAYYEDTDLAFAVRAAGREVYYQPGSVVVHYEGKSHGTDVQAGMKAYQVKNAETFLEKWRSVLEAEDHDGEKLVRARERTVHGKVGVVIEHLAPEVDRHAGARHTSDYIKLLRALGYTVKLMCVELQAYEQLAIIDNLRQDGIETFRPGAFFTRTSWHDHIRRMAPFIDLVVISRPHVARDYLHFCHQQKLKVIYLCHDLESRRMALQADLTGDDELRQGARAATRQERSFLELADHTLTPSTEEVEFAGAELGSDRISAVPLFVYDRLPAPPPFPADKSLVFVGSMGHAPNPDAVVWFAEEIAPLLAARVPDFVLHVVGGPVSDGLAALGNDNIRIHGYLSEEDLAARYAAAAGVVVPLRFGAGVKGKLIEAMAAGLPVVSTTIGVQGVPNIDDYITACDSAEAFADACADVLLSDEDAWTALSRRNRSFIKETFSTDRARAQLAAILAKIGEEDVRPPDGQ